MLQLNAYFLLHSQTRIRYTIKLFLDKFLHNVLSSSFQFAKSLRLYMFNRGVT